MTEPFKPMLLHHAESDFVLTDQWMLELKYDGVRAIVDTRGDETKITTRRGVDITFQFPEVQPPKGLLLDGEIVGFDGNFHKLNWVQRRMGIVSRDKVLERIKRFPIQFVAFDLLDNLTLDYENRIIRLVEHLPNGGNCQVSPTWPARDIDKMWKYVRKNNLEGLVAKKLSSKYVPGIRSYDWRKIKHEKPPFREMAL